MAKNKLTKSALVAALAVSAITPVAASAAEATQFSNVVFTQNGVNYSVSYAEFNAAVGLGWINPTGVTYVVINGKTFSKDVYNAAVSAQGSTDAAKAFLAANTTNVSNITTTPTTINAGGLVTTPVQTGELKVESVSAINGTELLVKFNGEVDKTSAEDETKYLIKQNGVSSPLVNSGSAYTATLQKDGKSVILTLATSIDKDSTAIFSVTVEDILKKGSLTEKAPVFTTTVTVADKVAPTAVEAKASTAGATATSISVTFSEPVQQPTVKVNGETKALTLAADGKSGTIQNVSLDATKSHTLEFVNLADKSNNVTANQSLIFNVTKDNAAPTYTLSTVSDNKIKLTFNKKMDVDTVTSGVTLKGADLNDLPAGAYTVAESTVASEKGTVFYVTLTGATGLTFAPFNGKNTEELTVLVKDTVKDSLGNKSVASSQKVTLTKDVTAPTLAGVEYIKNAAGEVTTLLLKYDEVVALNGLALSDLTATNIVTGAPIAAFSGAAASDAISVLEDGKTIKVPLKSDATAKLKTGRVEISVATGKVKDTALTANNALAAKKVVDFGAAAAGTLKATVTTPSTNNVRVVFDSAVTYESATNPANYTLNGLPLPAETAITFTSATQIDIVLPAEFVKANDTGAVFRVQNVATAEGVKVSANQTVVTVADNAGPVIVKEKSAVNSNGTLTLGFDEKVTAIGTLTSAAALADLKITLNGLPVTIASTPQVVITNGEGADAGKYVLTFNAKTITTTATDNNTVTTFFDANGNGTYESTADILIKRSVGLLDAELSAVQAAAATTLNLNNVSAIVIGSVDAPANITDQASTPNTLVKKQSVTIK